VFGEAAQKLARVTPVGADVTLWDVMGDDA
jgi:hypothetical protein